MTIPKELDDYDWEEAFGYAVPTFATVKGDGAASDPLTRDDVAEIIAMSEGENDGPQWLIVFKTHSGLYAFLEAGCDYTGWD